MSYDEARASVNRLTDVERARSLVEDLEWMWGVKDKHLPPWLQETKQYARDIARKAEETGKL